MKTLTKNGRVVTAGIVILLASLYLVAQVPDKAKAIAGAERAFAKAASSSTGSTGLMLNSTKDTVDRLGAGLARC